MQIGALLFVKNKTHKTKQTKNLMKLQLQLQLNSL